MSKINQDVLAKMDGITLLNKNVNLRNFPDFLILGPQRTGSTWLHRNLKLHPQVFLTTPKEIFFFNLVKSPEHHLYQSNDLEWYLEFYHESFKSYLKNNLNSLQKYGELYRPKVRGEATASYATMSRDLIENVVRLNPNIKAILLIRNPIIRAWSHAKKDLLNL
ncbi:MAG: sulfotransferase, partial [Cyanobacteria bacterium P01_G01_bin.49]